METTTKSPRDKFYDQLKKVQQEVEELILQFSLGKAEAKDKFEEIKKDLAESARKWKEKYNVDHKSNQLRQMIDELELQLTLGKAEAFDKFEEQKKKILKAIQELEAELKSNPQVKEFRDSFKIDLEKFKLKMEILHLKFQAKKFDLQNDFKDEMSKAMLNVKTLINEKFGKTKETFSDFNDEIDLAYKHFKKAVQSFGKK